MRGFTRVRGSCLSLVEHSFVVSDMEKHTFFSGDLRPVFPIHHLIKGLALLGRLRLVLRCWIPKREHHRAMQFSREMKNLADLFRVMDPGNTRANPEIPRCQLQIRCGLPQVEVIFSASMSRDKDATTCLSVQYGPCYPRNVLQGHFEHHGIDGTQERSFLPAR